MQQDECWWWWYARGWDRGEIGQTAGGVIVLPDSSQAQVPFHLQPLLTCVTDYQTGKEMEIAPYGVLDEKRAVL